MSHRERMLAMSASNNRLFALNRARLWLAKKRHARNLAAALSTKKNIEEEVHNDEIIISEIANSKQYHQQISEHCGAVLPRLVTAFFNKLEESQSPYTDELMERIMAALSQYAAIYENHCAGEDMEWLIYYIITEGSFGNTTTNECLEYNFSLDLIDMRRIPSVHDMYSKLQQITWVYWI